MFSGYIFDVEGTLVDSVPQSLRSLQKALDQAGLQVPYGPCSFTPGLTATRPFRSSSPGLTRPSESKSCKDRERSTSRVFAKDQSL